MLKEREPLRLIDRARWLWDTTFPAGGWHFVDARFLAMRVHVDERAANRILPGGLRMAKPAMATLFVAKFPESRAVGDAYEEAGLFLHVERRGTPGIHCPWILVSDDIALILGRDVLGYPKKLGRVDFSIDGDNARAIVERKGDRIFEVSAKLGAVDPHPPPMEDIPTYNVIGPVGARLQWLVRFRAKEEIMESRRADASLSVRWAERDPIAELRFGEVESAHYYRIKLGGARPPIPLRPVGPRFYTYNWSLRSR